MKLKIETDVYMFAGKGKIRNVKPMPGTTRSVTFDTKTDPTAQAIWDGWVEMQAREGKAVELTIDAFRKAFDTFLIFIAEEERDNYPQVTAIEEVAS
ncbi:MAG: hypothetical protein WCT36_00545 [Candidatus Gracilibacteria bacterium]